MYDIRQGEWAPGYPETTGYIIPTFYDAAAHLNSPEYRQRAVHMADWLLTLQLPSGAFPIGPLWPDFPPDPIIFDTGQILHGLVRVYEETHLDKYLAAGRRAGDWLVSVMDPDGAWRKFTSLGFVHTYNVRVTWALLRLYEVTNDENYRDAARQNISWVASQQDPDGWWRENAFRPQDAPLTHTIAYTIEGLLESGVILQDQTIIEMARQGADALLRKQSEEGFLRARYGQGWQSDLRWSCLTGDAQMALIWLRLFELNGESKYLNAADSALKYVKQTQNRSSKYPGVMGGIAGSQPIYGDYEPYRMLNWAAKFFADALLLRMQLAAAGE